MRCGMLYHFMTSQAALLILSVAIGGCQAVIYCSRAVSASLALRCNNSLIILGLVSSRRLEESSATSGYTSQRNVR